MNNETHPELSPTLELPMDFNEDTANADLPGPITRGWWDDPDFDLVEQYPHGSFAGLLKFTQEFGMTKFNARVDSITRETDRNDKYFWKVKVSAGEDRVVLLTWAFSVIEHVEQGMTCEFTVEEKGGYLYIANAVPFHDVNSEVTPAPSTPAGPEPEGPSGYPASLDGNASDGSLTGIPSDLKNAIGKPASAPGGGNRSGNRYQPNHAKTAWECTAQLFASRFDPSVGGMTKEEWEYLLSVKNAILADLKR